MPTGSILLTASHSRRKMESFPTTAGAAASNLPTQDPLQARIAHCLRQEENLPYRHKTKDETREY
jgi:hypothetical protein